MKTERTKGDVMEKKQTAKTTVPDTDPFGLEFTSLSEKSFNEAIEGVLERQKNKGQDSPFAVDGKLAVKKPDGRVVFNPNNERRGVDIEGKPSLRKFKLFYLHENRPCLQVNFFKEKRIKFTQRVKKANLVKHNKIYGLFGITRPERIIWVKSKKTNG